MTDQDYVEKSLREILDRLDSIDARLLKLEQDIRDCKELFGNVYSVEELENQATH